MVPTLTVLFHPLLRPENLFSRDSCIVLIPVSLLFYYSGKRRTYTVRLGAGHRSLTLTETITGNGSPAYTKQLVGLEEQEMEDYFINWLVAALGGMDDAIEQSGGLGRDMSRFLDIVDHFFANSVTILLHEE